MNREDCIKRWRLAHPDKVIAMRVKCSAKRYKIRRELVDDIKLKGGCVNCGYNKAPEALQFDHVIPASKGASIGTLMTGSIDRLMAEIAKCVVRCANCHAIKTKKLKEHGKRVSKVAA